MEKYQTLLALRQFANKIFSEKIQPKTFNNISFIYELWTSCCEDAQNKLPSDNYQMRYGLLELERLKRGKKDEPVILHGSGAYSFSKDTHPNRWANDEWFKNEVAKLNIPILKKAKYRRRKTIIIANGYEIDNRPYKHIEYLPLFSNINVEIRGMGVNMKGEIYYSLMYKDDGNIISFSLDENNLNQKS